MEGGKYILDTFSATTAGAYANLKSDVHAPMIVLNACQVGPRATS